MCCEIPTWLTDLDFAPRLRFLEFRGIHVDPERRQVLDILTERRSALEIVFEYNNDPVLIRDGQHVPLSALTDGGFTVASADSRMLGYYARRAVWEALTGADEDQTTQAESDEENTYRCIGPAGGGAPTVTIDGQEIGIPTNLMAFNPEIVKRDIGGREVVPGSIWPNSMKYR
jgi:hypothetical protein